MTMQNGIFDLGLLEHESMIASLSMKNKLERQCSMITLSGEELC